MPGKKRKIEEIDTAAPLFCDFSCTYAGFGDPEVSGACRKELAVWCKKLKKFNNKNNRCLIRKS